MQKGSLFRGINMAVDHAREGFPIKIAVLMPNKEAASIASGTINLGKWLASTLPQDQMDSQEKAFQNMKVSRDGEVLKIGMTVPREVFFAW